MGIHGATFPRAGQMGVSENLDEATDCSTADVINFVVADMIAAPQRARNNARKGRDYVSKGQTIDGKTICSLIVGRKSLFLVRGQNKTPPDPPFRNGREKAYPEPHS